MCQVDTVFLAPQQEVKPQCKFTAAALVFEHVPVLVQLRTSNPGEVQVAREGEGCSDHGSAFFGRAAASHHFDGSIPPKIDTPSLLLKTNLLLQENIQVVP